VLQGVFYHKEYAKAITPASTAETSVHQEGLTGKHMPVVAGTIEIKSQDGRFGFDSTKGCYRTRGAAAAAAESSSTVTSMLLHVQMV
jgi:hypothetical protein